MPFTDITPAKLAQAAITGATTTIYTVPASTRALVKAINIVNTTAGALTVDVYLVPSAGAPATSNAIMYQTSLPARAIIQSDTVYVMNAGDTIRVLASAVGATITISGGEAV